VGRFGTMARYTTTASTRWDRRRAFDYLADFANVADWDPSIPRARCVSGEALEKGARFEVEVEALGRTSSFPYETIEIDAPNRVVLRAETGSMVSIDTLTFVDTGAGSEVTYDADITLKGPLKLIDPLFSMFFKRMGDKARDGLRRRLSEPPPESAAGSAPG
jgi:carbon monoxide dehydrogenase subunit G